MLLFGLVCMRICMCLVIDAEDVHLTTNVVFLLFCFVCFCFLKKHFFSLCAFFL